MKESIFKEPAFVKTVMDVKKCPLLKNAKGELLPEIAVVGRSNVGKSSLLNSLFRTKGFVKVSAQPGKTQGLNFFTVADQLTFVDLPGYGFAKVPVNVRQAWGPMMKAYLERRDQLKVILFLFDVRRLPQEDDKEFLEWAAHFQKSVILVLTKVDKLNQSEKIQYTRRILDAFNVENLTHVHYSSTKNIGRQELIHHMRNALKEECEESN